MIPFNKPYLTGKEAHYIYDAVNSGKLSGNGKYTEKCHNFFQSNYGFKKVLLTTSCTDALEMAAILINTQPGDEIIVPSFTFVSTANAFVLRGAKIIFADSTSNYPGIDANKIESLITSKTKAIVPVHYAGLACDMNKIMEIANRHNLFVIEDAAQSIDSYYIDNENKVPLGSIGHLATFSFHETKNIISGEGGMLAINNEEFNSRSEIIWEKGTNRSAFFRGEVDKYGWVDIGSSFLPAENIAAFLYAQLENIRYIQERRIQIWNEYYTHLAQLQNLGFIKLPKIPSYGTNNGHMFYFECASLEERSRLIIFLRTNQINAVFHYQSLHSSVFYKSHHEEGRQLMYADHFSDCLIRLPFYFEITKEQIQYICHQIDLFYKSF